MNQEPWSQVDASAENRGPFDCIFIDADEENIPEYFTWALELSSGHSDRRG